MKKSNALTEREATVRDYFARHPDKIEEGLKLVQKEYRVKGLGTIDILCRNDDEGFFAIVELKRDRVTPSKLRDQLARYPAALRLQVLPLDKCEVRCFLIGTDFDRKIRVLAAHLGNVLLKKLIKKGKGYSLVDVQPEPVPKLTLKDILSSWEDRIMLRGWAFCFDSKYEFHRFLERATGWLEAKSCDALMVIFEPSLEMMFPYHVDILTVAPDRYVGRSKIGDLLDLATRLAGPSHFEPSLTDTGITRYWFSKPGAPRIIEVVPFGVLEGLLGEEWTDYLLKKPHRPYHSGVPRWFRE